MPEKKIHQMPLRVYLEDTDAGQIVYHTNFIKYAERARSEFLRDLGYLKHQRLDQLALRFVVAHLSIDYKASAVLDDWLIVNSHIETLNRASLTFRQKITRGPTLIANLLVKLAVIDPHGRPMRLPDDLVTLLT
jgi:acyl-CoA thioester hydrolase